MARAKFAQVPRRNFSFAFLSEPTNLPTLPLPTVDLTEVPLAYIDSRTVLGRAQD